MHHKLSQRTGLSRNWQTLPLGEKKGTKTQDPFYSTDSERSPREAWRGSSLFLAFFVKQTWRNLGLLGHWRLWTHSKSVQRRVSILTRLVSLEGRVSEEVRRESRLFAFSRTVVNLSDEVWIDSWLFQNEVDPVLTWNVILSRQSLYWLEAEEIDPVVEKRAVSVWILYII